MDIYPALQHKIHSDREAQNPRPSLRLQQEKKKRKSPAKRKKDAAESDTAKEPPVKVVKHFSEKTVVCSRDTKGQAREKESC